MKKYTDLLEPDRFYHIYNRGINGEDIFKEERNYSYFLKKYSKYIEPIAETYAYALLKNHFHLCIKTLPELEVKNNLKHLKTEELNQKKEKLEDAIDKIDDTNISIIFGNEFGNLFKSYAQSINVAHSRTGGLFEKQFRRIEIENDNYLRELIRYIHQNPQKHNFVDDFRIFPHTSYNSILSDSPSKLKREEVFNLFGNKIEFEKYHLGNQRFGNFEMFGIEMD